MPRVSILQTNFTAGELSPRLMGRVDIARYSNGAEVIENAYPVIHGGVIRRSGTRYVAAAKNANKAARLIPYVFNREQAYILEFGDQYMRVFKDGAPVLVGGLPYEVATPYTEAMLSNIRYVQGADTMFLAHPEVPIYRLRRLDHDDWSLAEAPFVVEPFDEIGIRPATTLTLSAATVGTGRTATAGAATFLASDVGREIWAAGGIATITAVGSSTSATVDVSIQFSATSYAANEWQLRGSPQTTCTPDIKDPVGATITLTLSAAGWRSSDVGKYVRINRGLVLLAGYTSDTIMTGTIKTALDSTVAAQANAWTLESAVWNSVDGYPSCVTLHEQRFVAAGSPGFPQTVWMSRTGESLNFEIGTRDDDAMSFTISSDQVNPIQHVAQIKALVALTSGGEFTLTGGVEKPITPTNIQVKNQSVYGCSTIRPVRIGNELYFLQRANRKLRAMAYRFDSDSYGAPDLSVLAEHVTEGGIVDLCYQQEPESMLWAVRADGVMVTLTIDRDQDVIAWARQVADGAYESVASIPVSDGDEVYVLVRRTINGSTVRYIERFQAGRNTDACITGTHATGAATWTGLGHLEGETVQVIADGVVMPTKVVSGGQITIERNALDVEIGLGYETTIKTLTPEVAGPNGTSQASAKRQAEVTLRFNETTGAEFEGQQIPFRRFAPAILDSAVAPFTGDKRIEKLGWERAAAPLIIKQRQPLDFHLLAVIQRFTFNDG